jgi:hypothetical protein
MNPAGLNEFISGALALGYFVIALYLYSFWKQQRIGLLAFFGVAFVLLSIERVVLLLISGHTEAVPFAYIIRLVAFVLIIAGIIVQNRRSSK